MSDMTGVQVTIFDQSGGPMGGPAYRLGDYLTITPADVGSTFTITAATDADFTAFLAMITNGNDDGFGYSVAGVPMFSSVGHSWTEGNLFAAGLARSDRVTSRASVSSRALTSPATRFPP